MESLSTRPGHLDLGDKNRKVQANREIRECDCCGGRCSTCCLHKKNTPPTREPYYPSEGNMQTFNGKANKILDGLLISLGQVQHKQIRQKWPRAIVENDHLCYTRDQEQCAQQKSVRHAKARFTGIANITNGEFQGHYALLGTDQQINSANSQQRHENEQFIRDIQIFDSKNIDSGEWIAQIEKVALLTGKSEYTLALAKSSNTPYKMLLQCPIETPLDDLKCKLQEMHLMVATKYNTATDLLRKQRPNESLQDYIANWTEMCHCSMKIDQSMINHKLVIVLFVKNMYNKEILSGVPGAKSINTLLDAFKSAQMNLLKLKKY